MILSEDVQNEAAKYRRDNTLYSYKTGNPVIDYSLGYPRAIEKFGLYVSFFDNYLNHNR